MQGPIETALMLVAGGNAFLKGRDLRGFWPSAPIFRFTGLCEFRNRPASGNDNDEYPLVAADPEKWFARMKPTTKGFRLHHMEGERTEAQKKVPAPDRMLVAFVGGGPRWLIEAVHTDRSDMWEGFHRVGDRQDPHQKIWLCTNINQGEVGPGQLKPVKLEDALKDLRTVLPEIEAYAREEKLDNFADCFARASERLKAGKPEGAGWVADVERYSGFDAAQMAAFQAINEAWVFGGMGSWNDTGGGPRYDELSERLFKALNDTICGLANSTYAG